MYGRRSVARWRTYDIFSSADRQADKGTASSGGPTESLQAFGATMAVVYPGIWVLMLLTAYGIFANALESTFSCWLRQASAWPSP